MMSLHFFYLILLAPLFIFGRLHEKDCKSLFQQAANENMKYTNQVIIYNNLKTNDLSIYLDVLNQAIAPCNQAISYYDTILNDIAEQSKKHWHKKMREKCQKNKDDVINKLNVLTKERDSITTHLVLNKVEIFHQEANAKLALVNTKLKTPPLRLLTNIEEVSQFLNELSVLYQEAVVQEQQVLASLLSLSSIEEHYITLVNQNINDYQAKATQYHQEALDWPASVVKQKTTLKEQLVLLKEDSRLFMDKGLKRSCYETQKKIIPILEKLIECASETEKILLVQELTYLKQAVTSFEQESDLLRLTESVVSVTPQEFKLKEKERQKLFFKSDFVVNPQLFFSKNLKYTTWPRAIPLDGQMIRKENSFALYSEQFYRFLIQAQTAISELFIKIHSNGRIIHTEKILLPFKETQGWESYLKNGMLFVPETDLKKRFGLDLRLNFGCDSNNIFSIIVAQKSIHTRYQITVSIDEKEPLYECLFLAPPPWQLNSLTKPPSAIVKPSNELPMVNLECLNYSCCRDVKESFNFPVLDQLVEELRKDPLSIANYVQNEIALADPFLYQNEGIFYPPSIHRNAYLTYLEKQGSAWEQCQLLVYLLRKAGYQTFYGIGTPFSVSKDYLEQLLLIKTPPETQEALLQYPWVMFLNGTKWIALFPWMKDMQIQQGHNLYSYMPQEYASAHRWLLQYLKGDEKILKHIGPDGDDTAGVLFIRFVEEELRKQGLSLDDIGRTSTQIKKQFSSWSDFPRLLITGPGQILSHLDEASHLFSKVKIHIYSHQNPTKSISDVVSLARFETALSFIDFSFEGEKHYLHFQSAGERKFPPLELDETDQFINIKIEYQRSLGNTAIMSHNQLFSITKGTTAALCTHCGGSNSQKASAYYERFYTEKDEKQRLGALLAFIGASYFSNCTRSEKLLAKLHNINSCVPFGFGLVTVSPKKNKECLDSNELIMPQVDMHLIHTASSLKATSDLCYEEINTATSQYLALILADQSSNEHNILRQMFNDPYAVSTIKLLQLAHQQHQKNGLPGEGFLTLTSSSCKAIKTMPAVAQSLYFPQLPHLNLSHIQTISSGQWQTINTVLQASNFFSPWSYAYITPGLISNQDGTYQEMGSLIINPDALYALISNNNLILNGGLGSGLPKSYFTPSAINQWKMLPKFQNCLNYYFPETPLESNPSSTFINDSNILPKISFSNQKQSSLNSDIRPWYKQKWNSVADPVDTVTGAFYIDEVDLTLPGPFSLVIRRNYNSQNPLLSQLGCGWKLSLNPFLVEQEGKRFISELDGTMIVYTYNHNTNRWEVSPEDNPALFNFNQQGIGGCTSLFHGYIENDILYGADGSKRIYQNGFLQKWINSSGNTLFFFYQDDKLARIESSTGDFCGFHYNHQGHIAEIYVKDGRRIFYSYDSQENLVKVTLPNTAEIRYEYDHSHRLVRETKPHGKVLENIYDDQGRVIEQRTPMGPRQAMIGTAFFEYTEGKTVVTDAAGAKTIYHIYDKQIYKIIDPLGFTTLQSWFIDQMSWFDSETEQVKSWDQPGAAIRSLKTTTDKRGLTTSYRYDQNGNPITITITGQDLTGDSTSKIVKKFTYNEHHLCLTEELGSHKTSISYDLNFPYLPEKIQTFSEDVLISYLHFNYNPLGQLEKQDRCGAITLWRYNPQGLPEEKIQITGTDDPDVITHYTYNYQGQCTEIKSSDSRQKNTYDIMGSPIESKFFSPSGDLIDVTYIGYDLNNQPIWQHSGGGENITYFDYHASGLIKAKRQALTPHNNTAYTLYEYNSCGYLIEETDPRGYITYRNYDLLGRVNAETKEELTHIFSYEAGGLIATATTPSGAKTEYQYTTNGLLKRQMFPDGTRNKTIYDIFGRPVLEINNNIAWQITYDEAHHQIIKTHINSQLSEISEFDLRGNLIRFTDTAGYCTEKTYDSLNRLKTEKSPLGYYTCWYYQDNVVICKLPSGETTTTQYICGKPIKSEHKNSQGELLVNSENHFDYKQNQEKIVVGQESTLIWKNSLGLPIKIQKGDITIEHAYDACGNCIASTDGDGKITRQEFDGLGHLIQKTLPDGSVVKFEYDADANLSAYHLPNGNIWKASYDGMHRKLSEGLFSSKRSCGHWSFCYAGGYLINATDPMQRVHSYLYDDHGRIVQESVQGNKRTYTYESRGFLTSVNQTTDVSASWLSSWVYGSQIEQSRTDRSYDAEGHLAVESMYLNGQLIQQSKQKWTPNTRCLQIGNHLRNFTYQNQQLIEISTEHVGLHYSYNLNGSLKSKRSEFTSTIIDYNYSGLPETIITHLPEKSYEEHLTWSSAGKIDTYTACGQKEHFTYDARDYLKATSSEKYTFDFGLAGIGTRTAAPGWYVPQYSLDDFGKVLSAVFEKTTLNIGYNPMGEVIAYGQKQLLWDPWGRLIKVIDPSYLWEASYDAFGRRIQTRYTKSGENPLIVHAFYDPEEEFQDIGIQIGEKTFWKIYGPEACDAISDETGESVTLMYNALKQLSGVISKQKTLYNHKKPSSYGPLEIAPSIHKDLVAYAQSLNWHSKAQDPTGFIWMGDRYYDPCSGQFLSQDTISYPFCMNLYSYANGDPINYFDPDGRFASPVYDTIQPFAGLNATIKSYNNISAFFANHQLTRSYSFEVGSFNLPKGGIGFINGINNLDNEAISSGQYLSHLAQGAKIHGIYNATNWDTHRSVSTVIDVLECMLGHLKLQSPAVQLLKNQWNHFIDTHPPKEKFFQISHSGGALQVYHALLSSPQSVRDRIISLAIAPAAIIPEELCFRSYNYMSRRDIVPHLDIIGKFKYGNELIILEPHPQAKFWDHEFLSPTFKEPIEYRLNNFLNNYGGVK